MYIFFDLFIFKSPSRSQSSSPLINPMTVINTNLDRFDRLSYKHSYFLGGIRLGLIEQFGAAHANLQYHRRTTREYLPYACQSFLAYIILYIHHKYTSINVPKVQSDRART